jgi:hypothetical protein
MSVRRWLALLALLAWSAFWVVVGACVVVVAVSG